MTSVPSWSRISAKASGAKKPSGVTWTMLKVSITPSMRARGGTARFAATGSGRVAKVAVLSYYHSGTGEPRAYTLRVACAAPGGAF